MCSMNTIICACCCKIGSLHVMVVPPWWSSFKTLAAWCNVGNWIWSTGQPPSQISYNLWWKNQINLQYYTAPPHFDFCLKDCTIGQQYSIRNAMRLAIGRIIAANNCDTEACAFMNMTTISAENSPSNHILALLAHCDFILDFRATRG